MTIIPQVNPTGGWDCKVGAGTGGWDLELGAGTGWDFELGHWGLAAGTEVDFGTGSWDLELKTGTGGWILVLGARISNWGLELGLVLEAGIWNCRGLVLGLDFGTTGCDLELGNGTDYWGWDLELVAAT